MALIMGSAFSMRGKPAVDERVVSHFRLVEALGSGSMGRVYKAWDLRLNRWVALKFLPPQLADDSQANARFRREAEAASSLEHGHICSIFDIEKDDTGDTFLVMAWYDGETIAQKLEAGPVRPNQSLKYARQIALGLAAAHRQGIVHRDIKPANVIITRDDEAVILDFGVAYLMDQTRLSQPGGHSGTLAYMAPEQFTGSDPHSAMDIWSLGVLLYEMLTGGLPFWGDYAPALTYAITHEDPRPLPAELADAIPDAQQVIDRCLAKQPQDRYPAAADLATDLKVLSNESQVGLAATRPMFRIAGRWRRRTALGVAALVLVGVGVIAGMKGLIGSPGTHRPGVAVLPFVVNKDGEIQREFGEGLAWLLANRLGHLAGMSDKFWIVPPEDVLLYEIRDPAAAKDQLGVDRTLSGVGTISGSNLSLHLEYLDAGDEAPVTHEFFDDLANLPTWQSDLMAWSLAQLDSDLGSAAAPVFARGSTQVPEALYALLEGIAWSRRYPGQDLERRQSYGDRALSAFGKAVARDSSFACARSEFGNALLLRYGAADSTRLRESEAHLQAARALDLRDAEPRYYLGNLYCARGDTQRALAAYDEALRREPHFKPALLAKFDLGLARQDQAACDRMARALHEARPAYAVDDLALGLRYWNGADLPRSVASFREAVRLAPRSARALSYLGAAVFELDKSPEAETLFRKSLALEASGQVHQLLGTYYYYHNRYGDALTQYRKALALQPAVSYDIWANLAECYRWSLGYEDSMAVAYQRARQMAEDQLHRSPADTWLMAQLATFCSVLGDTARTLDLLAKLTDEDRLSAADEFMITVAWEDLGRRAEALEWLERAFTSGLRPTRVESYPGLRMLRTDPRYAEIVTEHR